MSARILLVGVALAGSLAMGHVAAQPVDASASLAQRLATVEADPQLSGLAALERLQARQALDALTSARGRNRDSARLLAERRVRIAEVVARTQAAQREVDRLDRERSELLVEASRRDAAAARAEAERLRVQAQIQAEEAERLRQQAAADALAIQDIDATLQGVAGAQSARLSAAREKEAALARQEAELLAGGKLPPSHRESRGEVFSLGGDAFASGQAALTAAASASVKSLAAYLEATPGARVRVEGYTDNQGAADANLKLSQRRADAVRAALTSAGVPAARVQAVGLGAGKPVASNDTASGRARNRRVEIIVSGP